MDTATAAAVPYSKIIETVCIVVLPIFLGMLFLEFRPAAANRIEPWVQKVALGFIVVLALIGLSNEREMIFNIGLRVALAVIAFNLLNLLAAFFAAKFAGLSRKQAIAITFEVGIHNCTLAMGMAMSTSLFNSTEMAVPAIFYSIFMQVSAGVLVRYFRSQRSVSAAT